MPPADRLSLRRVLAVADRTVARLTTVASWLAVPLALLLCLQWPLRDGLHAFSGQANDLAQLLFAAYVGIAITHATRTGSHLTPDLLSRHHPEGLRRRVRAIAACCVVLPWSVFVFLASLPMVGQSLAQLERFPETGNPGYCLLKLCVPLMALLMAAQSLLGLRADDPPAPA